LPENVLLCGNFNDANPPYSKGLPLCKTFRIPDIILKVAGHDLVPGLCGGGESYFGVNFQSKMDNYTMYVLMMEGNHRRFSFPLYMKYEQSRMLSFQVLIVEMDLLTN